MAVKVKVYENILSDLNLRAENVPLLAGGVVPADQNGKCAVMNEIIAKLPETIPTSHLSLQTGVFRRRQPALFCRGL